MRGTRTGYADRPATGDRAGTRSRRAARWRCALSALAIGIAVIACGADPYAGQPDHVKRRHIALEGAQNFRDLGGYETSDGKHVRWGLFYRSDNLAGLSESDLEVVRELGIRLVCDFRSPDEKRAEPDRLPEPKPTVAELEIFDASFSAQTFREKIESGDLGDLDLRQALIDGYRLFATKFAPPYRALFERLEQPANLPAVIHCTAGKDRAGFGSAMILSVLGVPRQTVFDDFLLTNVYTADKTERTLFMIRLISLFRIDPERLRPVLGVERAYLEAAFDAIDENYGDFERYRREALGIDDSELAAFRAFALE
jgi:protein-tyrosine phosphatase